MSILDALASQFVDSYDARGIDWARYDAQGQLLADPRYSYRDELLERTSTLHSIVGSFNSSVRDKYRNLRREEGRAGITRAYEALERAGGLSFDAAKEGAEELARPFTMVREHFEDAVAAMAAYTTAGAVLHYDLVMADAVYFEQITEEQLRKHADTVARMCDAFAIIDADGGFNDLKPGATSGVGWTFVVSGLAAVAIIGVAAVLGIAFVVYGIFVTLPAQDKALALCDKLIAEGRTDEAQSCIQAANAIPNPENAAPWGNTIKTVTSIAVAGVALYVASLVLPSVVRGVKRARAA